MRKSIKGRLTITGLVLAGLPFLIYSVVCAHITFETSLNLFWALLAVGAFVYWAARVDRPRAHTSGIVGLVFILSLLFPVISANDDLAQLDLINDAKTSQAIASSIETDKQQRASVGPLGLPALAAVSVHPPLLALLTSEFIFAPAHAGWVATPGDTTGNHSPPLC